jgi:hypothetical protein
VLALPHELFGDHELCHMGTIRLETEILGRWDTGVLALTEYDTLNGTGDFVLYTRSITRRDFQLSQELWSSSSNSHH